MNIFLFFTKYLYISKKSRTFVPKNKSLSKTMKRLVSIFVICLMALTLHAQRCAVMDFNAANGVSQIDIDGLSAIFTTYFTPEGYTAVDRLTIDQALAEEGYQRNHMSEKEALSIGKKLQASKVVVGNIKMQKKLYIVSARVMDVMTGEMRIESEVTFDAANYRTSMQELAMRLSRNIALPAGYVDLGLPSGTLWKDKNEDNHFYSYEAIVAKYGNALPTKEQFDELRTLCTWSWIGFGYKVVGPNGSEIIFPSAGYQHCDGTVHYEGAYGNYWSQTLNREGEAWFLYLDLDEARVYSGENCNGRSARLVKKQ